MSIDTEKTTQNTGQTRNLGMKEDPQKTQEEQQIMQEGG